MRITRSLFLPFISLVMESWQRGMSHTINEESSHGYTIHCPDQFTAVGDTCYYLSSSPAYLPVANQTCLAMGGFLVSIETPEENLRLYDWLSSSYYWPEWFLGPYLGLYRYDLDSYNFEWMNPASRWSTYRNWEGGAPSIVVGTDNCVIMTNMQATWYNYYCDALLQFVCEAYPVTPTPTHQPVFAPTPRPSVAPTLRPSPSPTNTNAPTPSSKNHHQDKQKTHSPTISSLGCPDGYSPIHSTCYLFMGSPTTFTVANQTCAQENGWLVTIESDTEDKALLLWLQSIPGVLRDAHDGSGPYIGLLRDAFSKDYTVNSFNWLSHPTKTSSSSSSLSASSSYSQWALNYPLFDQSSSTQANCVVISMESGWMNVACSSSHQFICETSMIQTKSSSGSTDVNASEESMLWSLLVPLTLLAGGLLFYCCVRYKRNQRKHGPDHQYLPDDDTESVASTHSLVDNHQNTSPNSSTHHHQGPRLSAAQLPHQQQQSPDGNGKYLSKYNYSNSPEETMEIQLQMRSYAPLTHNSV